MLLSNLEQSAQELLAGMVRKYDQNYGFGHMSCTIYDTAWLAMVRRKSDSHTEWLFDQSFKHVLDAQQSDGGWQSYPTQIDGILNSLAAVLAICKRLEEYTTFEGINLEDRRARGANFLTRALRQWDVLATQHVGFEVLVPALLNQLEILGTKLELKRMPELEELKQKKMSRFNPDILYGNHQMTALHSLEAFVGIVDFNRLSHHKVMGSMLGSLSSTAAYLMNISSWDAEAEAYLHHVVAAGEGKGTGAVPPAFPSDIFEISWVLSTLLESGLTTQSLGEDNCTFLVDTLDLNFKSQSNLMSFGRGLLPDADDTAKTIVALKLLGRSAAPRQMIREYESNGHFRTYSYERNPSFSANCNILRALLMSEKVNDYTSEISKAVNFICDSWWNTDGQIQDKWNLSPYYSNMLMSQSLMHFLSAWDHGSLVDVEKEIVTDKLLVSIFQALVRTLDAQNEDGSWGRASCEESAYAILTIVAIRSLPAAQSLREKIDLALERGRTFILQRYESEGNLHAPWIGKINFRSRVLFECYLIAALHTDRQEHFFSPRVRDLLQVPATKLQKFMSFYRRLPIFARLPEWKIQASLIESYLFLPKLKGVRLEIFPRKAMAEDKYFEYIPFVWVANANCDGIFASAKVLFQMMVISFLDYQVDEYVETVVNEQYGTRPDEFRKLLREIFDSVEVQQFSLQKCNGLKDSQLMMTNGVCRDEHLENVSETHNIRYTITKLVSFIMQHPQVATAGRFDKQQTHKAVYNWLLAHNAHDADNASFQAQANISSETHSIFADPKSSYHDWVRTTASESTAAISSFTFYTCLLGRGNKSDFFASVQAKYYAQEFCKHVATMSRMYNDYGSLTRDRKEKTVNSVNFPEFNKATTPVIGGGGGEGDHDDKNKNNDDVVGNKEEQARKAALMELAEFERDGVEDCLARLKMCCKPRSVKMLELFYRVADTYGQIYVLKDISSRMKGA